MIVGADAVNMYPSLDELASGRAAKKTVLETKVKINGVNHREGTRYIAMELDETERRLIGLGGSYQ